MATEKDGKKSFKDTLNLPKTDFPIRPNAKENDPKILARWEKEHLFAKSFTHNEGKQKFILHDGPPYANGNIHIGHAFNKILKDMVGKSQRMLGKQVPITPGWDCHGLPIELKVTQENPTLSRTDLKKECRKYAQKWIDVQRAEFKQLGVLMHWSDYYATMQFGYEAHTLQAFGEFVAQGYIERKNKTVPWCASCKTVLASAEIEYEERKDPSIFVTFPLEQSAIKTLFPDHADKKINMLIWTTTPWTLPLNRAVLIKPNTQYVVLDVSNQFVTVAKDVADNLVEKFGVDKKIVAVINAQDLVKINAHAHHPFIEDLLVPIIADQSVVIGEGTACVHSAPGAGPEDYEVGVKNKLEIYSPVGPDGVYTPAVFPKELAGMHVKDGNIWVIKKLAQLNRMLHKESIRHPYPHCWRCHNGLIFRATKQWFCDLSKNDLKQRVLKAIPTIESYPPKAANRLRGTVEGRLEWCLSRQRVWGTPIPALICTTCDHTYITKELIDIVAQHVKDHGIEWWDEADINQLLPRDFSCNDCDGKEFKKETDILDVWFDSGVSHQAVLKHFAQLYYPADMYAEGSDQHRGWFQSSLLTSVALEPMPCTKSFLTHGFTVDAKGRKMSKSIGNVVSPEQMIEKLGTDGLRLWAAMVDYSGQAVISDVLLKNVQQVYRKIRNTSRFLLSNLFDFDIKKDALVFDELLPIDQHALHELFIFNYEALKQYVEYDFTAVTQKMSDYCTNDLSSYYLDIIKDRLYCAGKTSKERRSAQTACWYILDTLTKLTAPILSFTAEQVSDHYQTDKKESIHLQDFNRLPSIWDILSSHVAKQFPNFDILVSKQVDLTPLLEIERHAFIAMKEQRWEQLKVIRSVILKALEEKREAGEIKHSLDARVIIFADEPIKEMLEDLFGENIADFFEEYVIVSQFELADLKDNLQKTAIEGLFVGVQKAQGEKCPRCWNWDVNDHPDKLCRRCKQVV